jgi:hypothetical protein
MVRTAVFEFQPKVFLISSGLASAKNCFSVINYFGGGGSEGSTSHTTVEIAKGTASPWVPHYSQYQM